MMRPETNGSRRGGLKLLETQRAFAELVMRGLDKNDRMRRVWKNGERTADVAARLIKPNDRLSSLERIEIYNRQYWFRLLDSLREDFPGVRAVLGENRFDRAARAYLEAHPSRSFTLRNLGRQLVEFLEKRGDLTGKQGELAVDMARFEWAQVEAFDGAGFAPLGPVELARVAAQGGKAKLSLQPYLRLLELRYPLDDFLIALKRKNAALRREASNAMEERPDEENVRKMRLPRKKPVWLAVHRYDNSLYYKRLPEGAFRVLEALQEGKALEKALARGAEIGQAGEDWGKTVREWFELWTKLGWFCELPGRGRAKGRAI